MQLSQNLTIYNQTSSARGKIHPSHLPFFYDMHFFHTQSLVYMPCDETVVCWLCWALFFLHRLQKWSKKKKYQTLRKECYTKIRQFFSLLKDCLLFYSILGKKNYEAPKSSIIFIHKIKENIKITKINKGYFVGTLWT